MSQGKYRQPLVLEPRSSRRLRILLAGVHLLAAIALIHPLELHFLWRMTLLLGLGASAFHHLLRTARSRIARACWRTDGRFELHLRNGRHVSAGLRSGSVVSEWLVILYLQGSRRRYAWLLLPDMLDAESWRRLCVRLRQWHGPKDASASIIRTGHSGCRDK